MAAFRDFVRSRSLNTLLSWVVVAVLCVGTVQNLVLGNFLWAVFDAAVVAAALVPTLAARDQSVLVSWQVLAVAALPVLARWAGVLVQPATYLAVAALGLLVAVEVDAYSQAEMPPWFAVTFVVLTTMAVAGVWGVLQYYSDVALGTSFLSDRADLMWDLVAATAVGIGAGIAFELYFRKYGTTEALSAEVSD